jgi:AhpD family alkylhydroperoxidase
MLSEKEQELIAVGASVAAGCQPCTTFHLNAVRLSGAGEDEIRRAVDDAVCVRTSATDIMASWVTSHLGATAKRDAGCCTEKPLLGELVSIAAAYAVNSIPSLEQHLTAARARGATDGQILTAIKIACAIKNTAAAKVEAKANVALGGTAGRTDDDCGCQEEAGAGVATPGSNHCGCK